MDKEGVCLVGADFFSFLFFFFICNCCKIRTHIWFGIHIFSKYKRTLLLPLAILLVICHNFILINNKSAIIVLIKSCISHTSSPNFLVVGVNAKVIKLERLHCAVRAWYGAPSQIMGNHVTFDGVGAEVGNGQWTKFGRYFNFGVDSTTSTVNWDNWNTQNGYNKEIPSHVNHKVLKDIKTKTKN